MDHCEHADTGRTGLFGQALDDALADAEARCGAVGQRLTAPRRRVLELLLGAEGPVKAYDLIGAFGAGGGPAKPPTVYRALDFLERQGFVHRIESLNAYIACRLGGALHAAAFLICDCCGAAREIAPAGAEAFVASAERVGYEVKTLTVEARGRCGACRVA
ncbi:Fur family transcriptional regulator [Caulobacter sp. 17J65-9]|uniref:Fur family transcriptional regulator n=1 Tax=Caulobacter sp. 17J65-9 TaxID=2709382 RepID=UPI0013C66866|nr:Fur family transcriptional regulator [Caulobacter sp. 17J65-9]NEX91149.1 transcriptional repressor [Caulobacter sp. 17J65-9]